MAKKSENPRRDKGVTHGGFIEEFSLSSQAIEKIAKAGGWENIPDDAVTSLNSFLERHIARTAWGMPPPLVAVRNHLDNMRKALQTLDNILNERNSPESRAAWERLKIYCYHAQYKELAKQAEIDTLEKKSMAPLWLSAFAVICEKALKEIDQKKNADKGGRNEDESRKYFLSFLVSFFKKYRGKRGAHLRFIRAVVGALPKQAQPDLPDDESIKRQITRLSKGT